MSVEVPKSQHKYVIGHRGSTIAEILQTTGVSVEMPPNDSTTGTITLRGPHEKLGLGGYLCIFRNGGWEEICFTKTKVPFTFYVLYNCYLMMSWVEICSKL